MRLAIKLLINALVLLILAYQLPGISVDNYYSAIIAAFVLALVNTLIRPIILFFTLPFNILTLGLFTLVVNGFLFWFVGTVVKGFTVSGFMPAFWGALIMAVVNWILLDLLKR
ncbi:MAG: hypothetical protein A2469_02725 [Candidatus Magasanikbacteria bacterium RIFOXYC2_FULL_40_16]|uniref:Phage holin family protein n=1 Tax=Candidatus Magasanikbacteria bacterium RIFOXYC2_FULL_40_16 TaxID=1798703 RepID=A0A1F6NZ74_9BACT|nr:MAG: hypothetical protein A2469_02725 [Candidatus Magasanikbacteria bacterium RIFOXYC2_FULL_40_16]